MPTPNDFTNSQLGGEAPEEYGQVQYQPDCPYPGPDIVPDNVPSKQFSSDTDGDPRALARATNASQDDYTNLQCFLNNSLETPGCRVINPQYKPYKPPHGAEGE